MRRKKSWKPEEVAVRRFTLDLVQGIEHQNDPRDFANGLRQPKGQRIGHFLRRRWNFFRDVCKAFELAQQPMKELWHRGAFSGRPEIMFQNEMVGIGLAVPRGPCSEQCGLAAARVARNAEAPSIRRSIGEGVERREVCRTVNAGQKFTPRISAVADVFLI